MDRIFYMELGRSAVSGGGELWMEVNDGNTACNIHYTINRVIFHLNSTKEENDHKERIRSSSANESSKPTSLMLKRNSGMSL